jgi:uncharacterized protein YkwD
MAVAFAPAVTIDGRVVDFDGQMPVNVEGRIFVPARGVFEMLGFSVDWEPETATATLANGETTVIIPAAEDYFMVNCTTIRPDIPQQIMNGRIMLPIRAISEAIGVEVLWNSATQTVEISTAPPENIVIPNHYITPDELAAWRRYFNFVGINEFEYEVVRLTNEERARAGVAPLEVCPLLMQASRFKSQSMYDLEYFDHHSPIFGPFYYITKTVFGCTYTQALGENLARGHRSPADVVAGWMESPSHRVTLLNPIYTHMGAGFYEYHWVQKLSQR